ncbi:MAG: TIGR04282 family arsenosugar biosynthesis glycosyltransferase [Actinomycetota bacterium]|nr:TIGR04282 family arsenosugar biosynthesis glycosyltransferase [Actinomycetota bacterium]
MAKAPIPGTTKTRLRLPPESAARLQEALIPDAVNKAKEIAPVTIAGTPADSLDLIAPLISDNVEIIAQVEGELGERMLSAARHLFDKAPSPVIILGTDAPSLPPSYIKDALIALRSHDVSLTPSEDGGYVLIGLQKPHEAVFENVDWSTEKVHRQTLERARDSGLTVFSTAPWYDVDEPEDLERLARDLASDPMLAPRTATFLRSLRT